MLDFTFLNETKLVFGRNAQDSVGKESARWGKKVLLHYGGGHIVKSGLKQQVVDSLKESGLEVLELGGVVPNPRLSLVKEGIDLVRKQSVDLILAVGGGSVIDSAKAIAIGVPYDGDVWDFFAGKAKAREALPIGVILTIPAAGSESSPSSVITNEETWAKIGYGAQVMRPKFALLNPELTYSLPAYQTACGISDMLAHIMERYFTREEDVGFGDHLCEGAMRGIIQTAPLVIANPNDYGPRANIMWAGTFAHNDILGMGRSEDWASHNIEHELSALYDVAHGAGLAIVFPAWMKYVYKQEPQRFVQFATRVFGVEQDFYNPELTILEGIRRLEDFFRSIGLPTTLTEAGLPVDRFADMARQATADDSITLGNFMPLRQNDVLAIYELCQG